MARPIIPLKHFNSHEEMFVLRVHGVACGTSHTYDLLYDVMTMT